VKSLFADLGKERLFKKLSTTGLPGFNSVRIIGPEIKGTAKRGANLRRRFVINYRRRRQYAMRLLAAANTGLAASRAFGLRNDLYCVGWGVKLTHSVLASLPRNAMTEIQ